MTDQEFRPHVERWLAAYHERNRLSRLIQTNSAQMGEIKLPGSVLRLDDLADQMKRIEELEAANAELRRQHRQQLDILNQEERVIRQQLPQDIWYHVNGVGIMHVPHTAIMVKEWEEIEVEYAQAA
jgi:hypothetical protein